VKVSFFFEPKRDFFLSSFTLFDKYLMGASFSSSSFLGGVFSSGVVSYYSSFGVSSSSVDCSSFLFSLLFNFS
jgi:hypothetical protein